MSGLTRGQQLANYVSSWKARALPPEVLEAARQALVDFVGVSIAAHNHPAALPARRMVSRWGVPGRAQIILGGRTTPAFAALINGSMTHAMDLDDTHSQGCGHPSGPCWSSAMAMAQQYACDELTTLKAFVTGYEVMARLGGGGTSGVGRTLQKRGFHPTSVVGRVGATAAASVLLNLDAGKVEYALGVAATTMGGLLGSFGTHGKPFHAGKAALDGILSAELATEGFVAATQLYELKGGWLTAFLRDDTFDVPNLEFAEKWELLETGYKRYASCRATHTPIEAAVAAHAIVGERPIKSVKVIVDRTATVTAGNPNPKTGLEARFSIACCVAMALVGYKLNPFDFEDDILRNPKIAQLLPKIECVVIQDQPEDETHLEVVLADGEVVKTSSEIPFGDPRRPFSWDDHFSKFTDLVTPVLGQSTTNELFNTLKTFGVGSANMESVCRMISK